MLNIFLEMVCRPAVILLYSLKTYLLYDSLGCFEV